MIQRRREYDNKGLLGKLGQRLFGSSSIPSKKSINQSIDAYNQKGEQLQQYQKDYNKYHKKLGRNLELTGDNENVMTKFASEGNPYTNQNVKASYIRDNYNSKGWDLNNRGNGFRPWSKMDYYD